MQRHGLGSLPGLHPAGTEIKPGAVALAVLFHGRLNDFLPPAKRGRLFHHQVKGSPSLGDTIEALGVPHPEIAGVRVRGRKASWTCRVKDGDTVQVYPDNKPAGKRACFLLDVHLGKLARELRLLGFDTLYRNDYTDAQIASLAAKSGRIVLTRDVGLLKHKKIQRGYWLRETDPRLQIRETMERYRLRALIRPFRICLACNGTLKQVSKERVAQFLPARTRFHFDRFYQCRSCAKIYWKGSHYKALRSKVDSFRISKK